MADTTLSPTNLEQIEVGASEDTWGDKINQNTADINSWFQGLAGAPVLKIANGGTGGATAADARAGLELTGASTASFTETTWTPTLALSTAGTSSFAYAKQYGAYRRVGSWVTLDFVLTFTPTIGTGSGTLLINGIPVSAVAGDAKDAASGAVGTLSSNFTGYSGSISLVFSSVSNLRLVYTATGGAGSVPFAATNLAGGSSHTVSGSITYRVA